MSTFMLPCLIHNFLKVSMSALDESVNLALFFIKIVFTFENNTDTFEFRDCLFHRKSVFIQPFLCSDCTPDPKSDGLKWFYCRRVGFGSTFTSHSFWEILFKNYMVHFLVDLHQPRQFHENWFKIATCIACAKLSTPM